MSNTLKLALMWALSLVIVFAPYVVLSQQAGHSAEPHVSADGKHEEERQTAASTRELVLDHYGWILAGYLAIAFFFTPAYERNDVRLFGGLVSIRTDSEWDRLMESVAIALYPGRIVWTAVKGTLALMKG